MKPDTPPQLILASASVRRHELLRCAGIRFEVDPSDVPESALPGESPLAYARRMALEKARCVRARHDSAADYRGVLAADTVVVVDGEPLGKPIDRADARRMIGLLAGRAHDVITAFCTIPSTGEAVVETVTTEVLFVELDADQIERYLDRAAWQDKAGAYAIQEHAAGLVKAIHGSYTNVVGLPLAEVLVALDRADIDLRG